MGRLSRETRRIHILMESGSFYLFALLNVACMLKLTPWLVWLSGLSTVCEPKCHQFDSQSGHMLGLQARSLVGSAHEATTH